ncbi:MAG: hypothetical protein RTU30_03080 [Candidatus Thorarchaeota archaeon]
MNDIRPNLQNPRALLSVSFAVILLIAVVVPMQVDASDLPPPHDYSAFVTKSCTIFTAAFDDTILFCNNEDYRLQGTFMVLRPAQNITTPAGEVATFGSVGFGFNYNDDPSDGWIQGGMNDQGLCIDGNSLPTVSLNPHPELETPYLGPLREILFGCSTVNESIVWFQTHYCGTTWGCQIHITDTTGDAVVVGVGSDGEFVFTRRDTSHYLVSTNFNLANNESGTYPCDRFDAATAMLDDITIEDDLTVEACRDILDAVHASGEYSTKYSNIFNPVTLDIHLFQNCDFQSMVTLNLDEELAQVIPGGDGVQVEAGICYKEERISSLFDDISPTTSQQSTTSTTPSNTPSSEMTSILVLGLSAVSCVVIALWVLNKKMGIASQ